MEQIKNLFKVFMIPVKPTQTAALLATIYGVIIDNVIAAPNNEFYYP